MKSSDLSKAVLVTVFAMSFASVSLPAEDGSPLAAGDVVLTEVLLGVAAPAPGRT